MVTQTDTLFSITGTVNDHVNTFDSDWVFFYPYRGLIVIGEKISTIKGFPTFLAELPI